MASKYKTIFNKINSIFRYYRVSSAGQLLSVMPNAYKGKLYEFYALADIIKNLSSVEKLQCKLRNSTGSFRFLAAPGKIDRSKPYIECIDSSKVVAEIWTNVEFQTLSYVVGGQAAKPKFSDLHELDIVVVKPGVNNYPLNTDIFIANTCKDTAIKKELIREVIGLRRELSFYNTPTTTNFIKKWLTPINKQEPPVHILFYNPDDKIQNYKSACDFWDISLHILK